MNRRTRLARVINVSNYLTVAHIFQFLEKLGTSNFGAFANDSEDNFLKGIGLSTASTFSSQFPNFISYCLGNFSALQHSCLGQLSQQPFQMTNI